MNLKEVLQALRSYVHQPLLDGWVCCQDSGHSAVIPNAKQHLAWERGGKAIHLQRIIQIPATWSGYPLAQKRLYLKLLWWAQKAEFYVNRKSVLAGDLFDQRGRILLTAALIPETQFIVDAYLESPGHDDGALYEMALLLEHPDHLCDPGYLADELEIISLLPLQNAEILLTQAIEQLHLMTGVDCVHMEDSFQQIRAVLKPLSRQIKTYQVNLLGHSHIDMAWLWPHAETLDISERTFRSVLNLQKDYPELNFVQSTAYLYDWLEREKPELFVAIQQQFQQKSWEIVGGMWIEPDLNLPDGESMIRQILYGKSYFRKKFDLDIKVGWNPDSFGYTWQLPQIYKKSGIDYFLTQKLLWNDTTEFPHHTFWWQSPDGSRILTYFSPPLGEEIPPVKVVEYLIKRVEDNECLLWLYGVGDHGGGPTRDMLETQRRWQKSDFFPKISCHSTLQFFQELEHNCKVLPTWSDELYLEFHRGAYTTHAEQKLYNRKAEILLTNIEKVSFALAQVNLHAPEVALEKLWKILLFNQFHDILPGTSTAEVFTEANQGWQKLFVEGELALQKGLNSFTKDIIEVKQGLPSILVFNTLNWSRTELIKVSLAQPKTGRYQLVDAIGNRHAVQFLDHENAGLLIKKIPALSFATYQLEYIQESSNTTFANDLTLENKYLRVVFEKQTGNIQSIWDKVQNYEVLTAHGNQLQTFQDSGQYWDAWNIDPEYMSHELPPAELVHIKKIADGALYQAIKVVRKINQSVVTQEISLTSFSPQLTFQTHIDWQECHVLLKVAFPLTLNSDYLTCEVPMAVIDRTTLRETSQQQAQFEIPALRWVCYQEANRGLALLNDCKYGYDCAGNLLRLTLLRSPTWPDPQSDQGEHHFSYALYAYGGNWQQAGIIQEGHNFNTPLLTTISDNSLPFLQQSFLVMPETSLVMVTAKKAERDSGWILRFYESQGQQFNTNLEFLRPILYASETNLMEEYLFELEVIGQKIFIVVQPWEIKTIYVDFIS